MLSYRHAFHAGNAADVFKHVVLITLVESLQRKATPLFMLDTHAGPGHYPLDAPMLRRGREHECGLLALWWREDLPPAVARWRQLVASCDPRLADGAAPRIYPGSPLLLATLRRDIDRVALCELHPAEQPLLKALMRGRVGVGVHARDGYEALPALLPPRERRVLVLVDPAWETADETARLGAAVQAGLARLAGGVFAVWYPLLARKPLAPLLGWARRCGARRVLRLQMRLRAPDSPLGMTGCGLLVINAPWQVDRTLKDVPGWLAGVLGEPGAAGGEVDWLVRES